MFDVPMRPSGANASPVTGQRSPSEAIPVTGPMGKSDTRVPAASSMAKSGGQSKAEIRAADQHHGPGGMPDQPVHRREVMIDPAAEKAEPDEERRLHRVEALLQVGRVLLADLEDRHARGAQALGVAEQIHVADHRPEGVPLGQRVISAAVRRHRLGRQRQRLRQLARLHRPAADQRHRPRGADEDAAHGGGGACQSRITTAEMLFLGEPSITLSE